MKRLAMIAELGDARRCRRDRSYLVHIAYAASVGVRRSSRPPTMHTASSEPKLGRPTRLDRRSIRPVAGLAGVSCVSRGPCWAARRPPGMMEQVNRLGSATSPYLLQHADNPVDWWPWGPEAFAEAKRRDAPVLLSVGYAACHWCHVMAHESFEDDGVADLLNRHFVAIKVDREERPDVDAVYLTATTAMTGQGGWPMTCVLTPQAEPFF
jgi:hypothetical protein